MLVLSVFARLRHRSALAAACVLIATGLSALVPARPVSANPVQLEKQVCGTWVLQQVSSAADLDRLRSQIDAALSLPGVVGLSVRFPWKVADSSFAILERGLQIASARGKAFSPRFMAGRHTPARVFEAGSPYYLTPSGEKVPAPFTPSGAPNTVFETAWAEYVARLAAWSRAHGVRLLHLAWYGQDWAELNHGKEVRAVPGYSQAAWLRAHERLVDLAALVSGADLAVELPLSGYGPLSANGLSAALADRIVTAVGAGSSRFFVQANGWGPNGDWGAPDASTEADMDAVWSRPVKRGQQMIQPEDYDWSRVFTHLYTNKASYAEVYLPSFTMARKAQLAAEIARFSDTVCDRLGGDTIPPAVSITAPADGAVVAGSIGVGVDASDNTDIARIEVQVDGLTVGVLAGPGTLLWNTAEVADGKHRIQATAFDAAGNMGLSDPVVVEVDNVDTEPPAVPVGLAATGGAAAVHVGFRANTEADFAGYELRWRPAAQPTAVWATAQTHLNTHIITGLSPDTVYEIAVRAVDLAGNASDWSDPVTATTLPAADVTPPSPPRWVRAFSTTTQIWAWWVGATDDTGVVAYRAYLDGRLVATTSRTWFTCSGLRPGTSYTLTVVAVDRAGNTSASAGSTVRTAGPLF
jgi:hypothetical protein